MKQEIGLEQVEGFFKMMTIGELPDDSTLKLEHQLNLTSRQAFSIIYYLQEWMRIIPDKFNLCADCECLFNSEYGGGTRQSDNTQICCSCSEKYDFCCSGCCEFVALGTMNCDGYCERCQELANDVDQTT